MAAQRIIASLLAVAGSVSLVAIVPGVALASGGSSSTPPVDEPSDTVVDEPSDTVVDEPSDTVVDEPSDTVVDEPSDTVVDEPSDTVVDEPSDTVVDEPSDPTSVPEPGTIFAVGALAISAISMKRRMKR